MNWASSKDGATLVDVSSELEGCPASNVLNDDLSTIWLSEEGFPQWLCISLAKFEHIPNLVIRTVGWNCWHPYITNPKSVSMHVSSDGSKFKVWDNFEVPQRTRGTQLFSCAPVDTSMYPYIALEIARTFGGSQTYMNRVFLYSDEVAASPTSSKDGRSIQDDDRDEEQRDYALYTSHSNNMSDLSARTPERDPVAGRISQDTEHLVEQLQDALGLRNAQDDSYYYSDDLHEDNRVATAGYDALTEESPATVAGRLTHLEHTVHALEHSLLGHFLHPSAVLSASSSAPNVSFARSPTPPSRSHSRNHSRNQSPAASHASNTSSSSRRRRHSPSRSPARETLSDEQRVAVVTNRLDSIEEKLSRFMDTFETRAALPPPRPPPPPAAAAVASTPHRNPTSTFPWSEVPSVHSSLRSSSRQSSHQLPQERFPPQQRVMTQSTTSLSNATSLSTKVSVPPPQYPTAYTSSSPTRARPAAPSTAAVAGAGPQELMEQVVHSVETMMQRVLAQHELKHRMHSNDSTINSSSLFETPENVSHKNHVARIRSRSRSRSRSTSRRQDEGSRARSRTPDDSSEADRFNGRHGRDKGGVDSYISENAKRLLRRKTENAEVENRLRREAKEAIARREFEELNRGESSVLDSHNSDVNTSKAGLHTTESKRASARRVQHHNNEALLEDKESHNILERSIFELLKSKYGLGVSNESDRERTAANSALNHDVAPLATYSSLASLPMRVPSVPSSTEGPVVDWPQYVQNRVAASSGVGIHSTSGRLASPLRQRHAGIYSVAGVVVNNAENGDVLPRAKQHMRNRERSVSPLRAGLHESVMASQASANSTNGTTANTESSWWERDAEMAALVRTLHEKVYQRTVKEAQYDMLLCATESTQR